MSNRYLFDASHLLWKRSAAYPTGIERVDYRMLKQLLNDGARRADVLDCSLLGLSFLGKAAAAALLAELDVQWSERMRPRSDRLIDDVTLFLRGHGPVKLPSAKTRLLAAWPEAGLQALRRLGELSNARRTLKFEKTDIYLNLSQYRLRSRAAYDWFPSHRDLRKVFMVHDLLPLDYPEYWPSGNFNLFSQTFKVIAENAIAIVTQTQAVATRITKELAVHGRHNVPIIISPFPSPIEIQPSQVLVIADWRQSPYFLTVGTIEPRKNLLLLLNIWRQIAQRSTTVPKLIVVGGRGWQNSQIVGMLDRSPALKPHVLELSNLTDDALATLIRNARALLIPSFDEGYGLPIVEAEKLGTPVIASDIPVFREIASKDTVFLDPLDGAGWRFAIDMHMTSDAHLDHLPDPRQHGGWDDYYTNLMTRLDGL